LTQKVRKKPPSAPLYSYLLETTVQMFWGQCEKDLKGW